MHVCISGSLQANLPSKQLNNQLSSWHRLAAELSSRSPKHGCSDFVSLKPSVLQRHHLPHTFTVSTSPACHPR